VEDRMKAVVLHKNKQYQWLLVEAYEAFEDYIEDVYAYAALLDINLWPCRHFGNISLSELSNKDFNWFRNRVNRIKDKDKDNILNQFRNKFNDIEEIEKTNKLNVNLRLTLILINNLRHIIVHNGGIVGDKAEFSKKVLKDAGLYNNGKPNKRHVIFINNYFGSEEYDNNIVLLEVRIMPEIPIDISINRLDSLTGNLMSYAFLIAQYLQEYKNPTKT